MRCKKCKAEISKGSKFCRKCGEPVKRRIWLLAIVAVAILILTVSCAAYFVISGLGIFDVFEGDGRISSSVSEETKLGNAQSTTADGETYGRFYDNYQRVLGTVKEAEKPFVNSDGYVKYDNIDSLLIKIEEALRSEPAVGAIENNGTTVTVTLANSNARIVYEPPIPDSALDGDGYHVVTCEPYLKNDYHLEWEDGSFLPTLDNTKRNPKATSGDSLIDDTGQYVASHVEQYSFDDSNNYDDEAVSPRMFRGLANHQLVILNGHGGFSGRIAFLGTGVSDDAINWASDAFDEEYFQDWVAGRLFTSTSGHLLVPPAYFEYDEYFPKGCFDGSLFFLGTCDTLINDSLGKALVDDGAKLVVGSNETIESDYAAKMISTMLRHMAEIDHETNNYYTVSDALSFAETINNIDGTGYDMYPGRISFYPEDAGQTRLADVAEPMAAENENQGDAADGAGVSPTREIALILDVSGSMAGNPLDSTKNAASRFVDVALENGAQTALVAYDDDAEVLSEFTTSEAYLKTAVGQLDGDGGTNMESGLSSAYSLLAKEQTQSKYIVLMSDGEPNDGKTGDELISYAESIRDPDHDGRDDVIIYALGFNEGAGGQSLLRAIASNGCYISVQDAEDLEAFFQDMVDSINGVKFMYARVACPVDVSVTFNGETLDSAGNVPKTRASFGSLTFEEDENGVSDDWIKVLRLREGQSYDIVIDGTGFGTMDYTIGFVDDEGIYSDFRTFNGIGITDQTAISTTAEIAETTMLSVDEDGDGTVDKTYRAGANQEGELVDNSWIARAIVASFAVVMLAVAGIMLWRALKRRWV